MATESAGFPVNVRRGVVDRNAVPRSKRKLQKHLRSSGQAYISRTGKLIPAKQVPEELCQCPQKCDDRIPMEVRERLFNHFYNLGDADKQNTFLRQHMDVKTRCSINTLTGTTSPLDATTSFPTRTPGIRGPRRITCRYLIPQLPGTKTIDVCQKAFVSAFVITTKRVRLQREKLISSMGLNKYSNGSGSTTKTVKNFNNNNVLMVCDSHSDSSSNESRFEEELRRFDRRFQLQQQLQQQQQQQTKNVRCFKGGDDPFVPFGLIVPDSVTITPIMPAVIDHDADIAIVNNFFSNQLWKPEYLKSYS